MRTGGLRLLVVIVVIAVSAAVASSCQKECEAYNDCGDDEYCDDGTCVPAVVIDGGPYTGENRPVYTFRDGGPAVVGGVGGSGGSSSGGGVPGSGSGGTPGGGGGTMPSYGPPMCYDECASVSDCTDTPNDPLYGTHNWQCLQGGCVFQGCSSDSDCSNAFGSWAPRCDFTAWPHPRCLWSCTTVDDCAYDGAEIFDDDNWLCSGGLCYYQGCTSASECEDYYNLDDLACQRMPWGDVPFCWYACSSDADCYYGYACYSGACGWIGCQSDSECGGGSVCVDAP